MRRFLKMIWIVFKTQILLRVHVSVAILILAFPLIVFVLIVENYEHQLPEEAVPIIYFVVGFMVFSIILRRVSRKKRA